MLKPKDKEEISRIIKSATDARVIYRANALNLRHKGLTAAEVADYLEISPRTVFNIQQNYSDGGLIKALEDDPRPGSPPQFDDGQKAKIVAMVCANPPEGFDRWTLALISEEAKKNGIVKSISRETIRVLLQEHDLKPWLQKSWCVPKLDDEFIDRMEDVLALYEEVAPHNRPLVCLDEKPIQLLADVRPASGISPGEVEKIDYEYKRQGTANVFCAVEPQQGLYMNKVTESRTGEEFAKFMNDVARKYAQADKITLVMDNLNTHREKSLIDYYGEEKGAALWSRFDVHYTPKHGSWLNQAEIAINMFSRQCLGRSRIPDIDLLRKRCKAWVRYINSKAVKINWRFTRKDARSKFDYD